MATIIAPLLEISPFKEIGTEFAQDHVAELAFEPRRLGDSLCFFFLIGEIHIA